MAPFPFVHRLGDLQPGQALMGDLLLLKGPRDHTMDLATAGQGGVRHHPHQTDVATPVDEGDPALGEQVANGSGRVREHRISPGARPAEDAD